MAETEVTNAQFEQFDPAHKAWRGQMGLSFYDDDAAIYLSWHEALAYCAWLTRKDGRAYRLPTEAEWEYACRAGTTSAFSTGDTLPYGRRQRSRVAQENPDGKSYGIAPVSLRVGLDPANPWGLRDMHGNVEEWCADWYGPYQSASAILTDPAGPKTGTMRVTRGGSHNVPVAGLRSANRLGLLPGDRTYLTGFRVVQADLVPSPEAEQPVPQWARDVRQTDHDWSTTTRTGPYFQGLIPFVIPPEQPARVPLFSHNHSPSIAWLKNGDLLVIWFSCEQEQGRELTILGSRLRAGQNGFDSAAEFFKAPDRNMHGKALFHDGTGRILHLNGIEAADGHEREILVARESRDNGATWSPARIVHPWRGNNTIADNMMIRTRDGHLLQPCDLWVDGSGLFESRDEGVTWREVTNYGWASITAGETRQGWIAGIHGAVAQLESGALLAFGRGSAITGRMPQSMSHDLGRSWKIEATPFPALGSTQRAAALKLHEGPLVLFTFTDDYVRLSREKKPLAGWPMQRASGGEQQAFGIMALVSFDEGRTWPVVKLVTPGGPAREVVSVRGRKFRVDETHSELGGYLAVTQTPDGIVHLVSSRFLYEFNLAWLRQPPP